MYVITQKRKRMSACASLSCGEQAVYPPVSMNPLTMVLTALALSNAHAKLDDAAWGGGQIFAENIRLAHHKYGPPPHPTESERPHVRQASTGQTSFTVGTYTHTRTNSSCMICLPK